MLVRLITRLFGEEEKEPVTHCLRIYLIKPCGLCKHAVGMVAVTCEVKEIIVQLNA